MYFFFNFFKKTIQNKNSNDIIRNKEERKSKGENTWEILYY